VSLLVPTLLVRWIKADISSPTRHLFVVAHESSTDGQNWTAWKELVLSHSGYDN